ncbi:MAG: tetratricopeptide repeat protein [Thermoplasmata archaeon]
MQVEALRTLPAVATRKIVDDIAKALGIKVETRFTKGDFVEVVGKVEKEGAEKNFVLVLHTGSSLADEFLTAFKKALKRENAEALLLTTGNVSLELGDENLRILSGKALEEFLENHGIVLAKEKEKPPIVATPAKMPAEEKPKSQSSLPSATTLENYMKQGLKFFERKEYEKALQYFEEVLLKKPGYDRAISLRARCYAAMGKNEIALEIYRRALERMPENYELWYELADLLHQMGRFDEELECYATILGHNKKLDKVWNNMGIVYFLKEKYEDALFCFERANKLKPDMPDYLNNLATAQKKLRKFEDALTTYRRVLEIAPEFSDAHLNMGLLYLDMEKYEDAYRAFRKYLLREKNSAKAWHLAGIAAMNAGAYSQAIKCFEEALKINPELKEAREGLKEAKRKHSQKGDKQRISEMEETKVLGGGIAGEPKKIEEAISVLPEKGKSEVKVEEPLRPEVVGKPMEEKREELKPEIPEKLGEEVKAGEEFPGKTRAPEKEEQKTGLAALVSAIAKEVVKEEKEAQAPMQFPDAWNLVKLGRFEEAARGLEAVESKKSVSAAVVCGYAFAGASKFKQALECFETVLSQQKMHLPALFGREFAEFSLGNYEEALKSVEILSKKFPANPSLALKKCLLLFAKGEFEKCEAELKKIAKEMQHSEIYWFILGLVNLRKGNMENATKCFENALKIKPDFEAARKKL